MPGRSGLGIIRVVSISGAWLLTSTFIWVAFFYPESWLPAKSYEDPRLFFWILIGFFHLPYGGMLIGLWGIGALRLSFGISVLITPIVYLVGSPYNPPWAYVFYLGPSVFIIISGLIELCWPYGGGKTLGRAKGTGAVSK